MAAMETELFRIFTPLKVKETAEIEDKPVLSDDPAIAAIQNRFPYNFIFTVKNHLTLRGVSSCSVMTTPEELQKLFQNVLSVLDPSKEEESTSSAKLMNSINEVYERDDEIGEVLRANRSNTLIIIPYEPIDISPIIDSSIEEIEYINSIYTTPYSYIIIDEDGRIRLGLALASDVKILDIRQIRIRKVLRLYQTEINSLKQRTTNLETELTETNRLLDETISTLNKTITRLTRFETLLGYRYNEDEGRYYRIINNG